MAVRKRVPTTARAPVRAARRAFPTVDHMKKSPKLHVTQIHAKRGQERQLEQELRAGLADIKAERGINSAAVYKLVESSVAEAPTFLFITEGQNADVIKGMRDKRKYSDRMEKIQGMSDKFDHRGINTTLIGRVRR